MRILISTGRLTWSTPTTYAQGLVRGLLDRGHEVQVAGLGGPLQDSFRALGCEVFEVHRDYFSFRRFLGFLREFDPEIVHAVGGKEALAVADRVTRALDRPLVHTVHSWLPEDMVRHLPSTICGVIAVNQDIREHLVNTMNVAKGLIRVIPYGVVAPEIPPPPAVADERRIPVVGTVGRLERGRRFEEFLEIAHRVRQELDEVLFMVAGEGPDEARLRKSTKTLGLEDVVTFATPQAGIEHVYRASDVMVLVSDWGGMGIHLLEGMAQERPVVATGSGEVLSVLGSSGICVLARSGDRDGLAKEVAALIGDPDRRTELGTQARDYVLEHYPLSAAIERTEDYYRKVRERVIA